MRTDFMLSGWSDFMFIGLRRFNAPKASYPAVIRTVSLGIKRPGREDDSFTCSAD
jgi:hypothetical protein